MCMCSLLIRPAIRTTTRLQRSSGSKSKVVAFAINSKYYCHCPSLHFVGTSTTTYQLQILDHYRHHGFGDDVKRADGSLQWRCGNSIASNQFLAR